MLFQDIEEFKEIYKEDMDLLPKLWVSPQVLWWSHISIFISIVYD